jgi:hypothetical protein
MLTALTACGPGSSSDAPEEPSPTTTTVATPTPSVDSSSKGALELRGDWHDPKAEWIVHFHEDGTFVEDFKGLTDFRVGKYSVDGATVSLIGDDGNTDKGTIKGDTLVFRLGTLTKM